jgi:hypothetical protein
MNKYLIIDNNKQYRNTVVLTDTKNNALSEGASRLKTFNIRCIIARKNTKGTINKRGFEIM